MINRELLKPEVQDFIRSFTGDITKLAFSGSPFKEVTVRELMVQIEGRKKSEKKLPTWIETPHILFPPKLNLEQTSSETTAKYKAQLVEGDSLADITGGFGVDSFFFAENFVKVHHFEINAELSAIAQHNYKVFGKTNVQCFPGDGLAAVLSKNYTVIYADPSRRHDSKGKVFYLRDCQPNIPDNIDDILDHCKVFLLKTSPMLDISVGLNELKQVNEIHIVAIDNDVKELVWVIKRDTSDTLSIKTVNFHKEGVDTFNFDWEEDSEASYAMSKNYLYEPNAAILKSGAFSLISEVLKVEKLHFNTHLYTKESLIDFPGRRFAIEEVFPYSKSAMRELAIKKAHVATRNFPESVIAIRKKWKIADGGDVYLFFIAALDDKKYVLRCSKV